MKFLPVFSWCFAFSVAAGKFLNISDIRLVNGSGPYGGRVEIKINGIWGTVCDESFDFSDATVMCSMMNLRASTYMTEAWYGRGKGPIFAQNFNCRGYEAHLKDCSYVSNVHCTHARDIGIICSECPQIGISNGNATDISAGGTVLSAICNNGFRSNNLKSNCSNGLWSPPSIICKHGYDITDIRLVNGVGLYDGRVELLVNGTWGTICSTSFSRRENEAICRSLFGSKFPRIRRLQYYMTSTIYGPGKGPIYIDKLDCAESATSIAECSYSLNVSCKDHTRDVAVACYVYPLEDFTATRLVNGTGPYDGRIEIYYDGNWGTICNRYVGTFEAQTICSIHNASLAMYFTESIYGKGTSLVHIGRIYCYKNHDSLSDCALFAPYRPDCSHDYDLSIVCTPCGLPKIYNGEAVSFNYKELTVKCQGGFFPEFIKMQCLDNGTWVEKQRCTFKAYPINISQIRLRNDDTTGFSNEGRVEIFVNGTWGTVCNTNFDSRDAAVICRMFKLKYYEFYSNADNFVREKSKIVLIDRLNCNGTEKHINNCTYEVSDYCTHDVAVKCTGYQLNITDIRLSGTNGPYHGRVELEVDGTWGTVCHNNMLWSEAKVVCRMLGLEHNDFYFFAKYGPGNGPIYLKGLRCTGLESHINNCTYGLKYNYYCDHSKDASLRCYGPRLNITDVRLANGKGLYDGRAEIKVNNTWGTICDENFDMLDAEYFCKMLGLRAAKFYTGAFYGKGSGPVFIDQLLCDKNDYDLRSCKYLFLNECTHERDVSVVCKECGLPDISHWDAGFFTYNGSTLYADCSYYKTYIGTLKLTCDYDTQTWVMEGECQEYSYPLNVTDIRLVDGSRPSHGRVEIKSLNTWGTICDDRFGMSEANLICKMVGYIRAKSFHAGAFYGEGKGPIFANELDCKDNASDFNGCTYKTYGDCTHAEDISVVCIDCRDPTPEHGFVYISPTGYQTALHVTCEKDYKLIGEENIFCQANATWSNRPVCKLIDCGAPTPVHGSSNSSITTNGTVILVECDKGYNMTGEAIITCQPDETWTDTPSCVIIECRNPVPENGYANTTDTAYGTMVELTCKSGYSITGNSVIMCQEDGTWSDSPVCDISGKTDDDGTNKILVIVTVCMGISLVTIMGLVVVIVRRKRDTSSKKIGKSTDAAITEAETDLRYDNATQIHQTSSAREANPYESLRELRVNQSDYDMVMTPYEHYQTHDRNTAETEDTRCYQNLLLNK